MSSGYTVGRGRGRGSDAKTISPNTLLGDIIDANICKLEDQCSIIAVFPLALMMMIMMKALCECVLPAAAIDNENQKRNIFILVSLNSNKLNNDDVTNSGMAHVLFVIPNITS